MRARHKECSSSRKRAHTARRSKGACYRASARARKDPCRCRHPRHCASRTDGTQSIARRSRQLPGKRGLSSAQRCAPQRSIPCRVFARRAASCRGRRAARCVQQVSSPVRPSRHRIDRETLARYFKGRASKRLVSSSSPQKAGLTAARAVKETRLSTAYRPLLRPRAAHCPRTVRKLFEGNLYTAIQSSRQRREVDTLPYAARSRCTRRRDSCFIPARALY